MVGSEQREGLIDCESWLARSQNQLHAQTDVQVQKWWSPAHLKVECVIYGDVE